jgi:hypothetical protein
MIPVAVDERSRHYRAIGEWFVLLGSSQHRYDWWTVAGRTFPDNVEPMPLIEGDGVRIRRVKKGGQVIPVDDVQTSL